MKMYRYLDEYGLLREANGDGSDGIYDSIMRTSLLAISTKDYRYILPVLRGCCIDITKPNGIIRHPSMKGDKTMSRDHIIMLLVALNLIFRWKAESLAEELPFKISDKFKHSITSWLYVKFTHTGNYKLLSFLMMAHMIFVWSMYKTLYLFKVKKAEAYNLFPTYAVHIASWMLYTLPNNRYKTIACKLISDFTPKDNYLIQLLCTNHTYTLDEAIELRNKLVTRRGWVWQRFSNLIAKGIYNFPLLNPELEEYSIDVDIVLNLLKLNRENESK